MPRLGVLGWPVSHSRSPAMHTAAFEALGMSQWSYELLPAERAELETVVSDLPGLGFAGANVTIPHKEAALALAAESTPEAAAIGAANTLTFEDGVIKAANTDAPGFIAAIGGEIPATAMVLGAGGSARAIVYALEQAGAEVFIYNRTRSRAEQIGTAVDAPVAAEMLVNCTSLGLGDPVEDFEALTTSVDSLGTYATLVDLVYRQDAETELVRHARAAGCAVVDGLEILVRQGALSFELWTGHAAPLDAMRRGARLGETWHTDESGNPTSASSAGDRDGRGRSER